MPLAKKMPPKSTQSASDRYTELLELEIINAEKMNETLDKFSNVLDKAGDTLDAFREVLGMAKEHFVAK